MHFNAQVSQLREELSNRNASLGLAADREKLLTARLEDSLREIEALKSSLLQMTQNGAGSVEHAINVRVVEIEKTLAIILGRLERMDQSYHNPLKTKVTELEGVVGGLKGEILKDRDMIQVLHSEIQELKQDKWWAEDEGSPSDRGVSSQHAGTPLNQSSSHFDLLGDGGQPNQENHLQDSHVPSSAGKSKIWNPSHCELKIFIILRCQRFPRTQAFTEVGRIH